MKARTFVMLALGFLIGELIWTKVRQPPTQGAGTMKITTGVGDTRPPKKSRPETLTTTRPSYRFESSATTGLYTAPRTTGGSRFLMLAASSQTIATFTPILRDSVGGGCVSSLIITGRTDTIPVRLRCPSSFEGELGPLLEWMVGELNRRIPPK